MLQVSRQCLKEEEEVLGVLVPKSPRAFHLGECGLHHSSSWRSNCNDVSSSLTLIGALTSLRLAREEGSLYPDSLQVVDNQLIAPPPDGIEPKQEDKGSTNVTANGGWADPRDRHLCLSFSSN